MTASARKQLERAQRRWAERAGVVHDSRGFVRDYEANLRVPLSPAGRRGFARGSELEPRRTQPARIAALSSSAALVANVFDHWSTRDAAPLAAALGFGEQPASLSFEEPLPTGAEGDPPTADVALQLSSGRLMAIESKFCEWLERRPPGGVDLKAKYFSPRRTLWADAGLPRCQELADGIHAGTARFKHLHAAQLLKHALGLVRAAGSAAACELAYLYYDCDGRVGEVHRTELARFAECVGEELRFRASTYQDVFRELERDPRVDRAYLDYLRSRYFG